MRPATITSVLINLAISSIATPVPDPDSQWIGQIESYKYDVCGSPSQGTYVFVKDEGNRCQKFPAPMHSFKYYFEQPNYNIQLYTDDNCQDGSLLIHPTVEQDINKDCVWIPEHVWGSVKIIEAEPANN